MIQILALVIGLAGPCDHADINGDNAVDLGDYNAVLAGALAGGCAPGVDCDLSGDGTVDVLDVMVWLTSGCFGLELCDEYVWTWPPSETIEYVPTGPLAVGLQGTLVSPIGPELDAARFSAQGSASPLSPHLAVGDTHTWPECVTVDVYGLTRGAGDGTDGFTVWACVGTCSGGD